MITVEAGVPPRYPGDPSPGRSLATYAQRHADWAAADNRWLPVPLPTDAALAAALPAARRIDQDVRMYVVKVGAAAAVTRGLSSASTGYVFAVVGDVHLATDADAVDLKAGCRATIVDETRFLLRARTESANVLLIEMHAID